MYSRFVCALAGAAAIASVASGALAQGRDQWVQLGCAEVGRRPDLDVIQVGRREGRFKAIRLEVSGNDVHIENLKVIYANGGPDDIPVRSEIREGDRSRPLDLKGYERAIDRIELVSRRGFQGRGRGRAQVCIAGLTDDRLPPPPPPPPQAGRWEQLGCQKVGFLKDRDVITVGRREGRFRAVRLDVAGNDIHINDLKVIYANGEPDHIPVRANIRQNSSSGVLDLKGHTRAIDRIELVYQTKPNFRGSATVCVFGLH